jgi:hypothetical protein
MVVLHDLSPTATSQIEATVSTFAPDCPRAADVLPKLMAAANALPAVSLATALLFSASSSSSAAAAAAHDDDTCDRDGDCNCANGSPAHTSALQVPTYSDVERCVRRWGPCMQKNETRSVPKRNTLLMWRPLHAVCSSRTGSLKHQIRF